MAVDFIIAMEVVARPASILVFLIASTFSLLQAMTSHCKWYTDKVVKAALRAQKKDHVMAMQHWEL
jgi:hypothetical protein